MSILSDFEDRIAGAVEGLFAGAFKSPVQPAELAKALGRAMDDGRIVGVGKVYAPTGFVVVISEDDEGRMGDFIDVLSGELETFLVGHAQERGYALARRPSVLFEVDDDYKLGRYSVETQLAAEVPPPADAEPAEPVPAPAERLATVTVGSTGHDVALTGRPRVVVGRLADCDIVLEDSNVSRRHAAFVAADDGWTVEDLGSTNGTLVNGRPASGSPLADGDVVQVGITKLVFHGPRGIT